MGFFYQGEVIVSRQNRRIVNLCKLSDRKEREAQRRFRFDGIKLFSEAVLRGISLDSVFVREGSADRVAQRLTQLTGVAAEDLKCPVFLVSDDLFDKISEENAPEGVICVAEYIDKFHKMYIIRKEDAKSLPEGPILLLESVRDPLNVGAIIRSAAALGVEHLCAICQSALSPLCPSRWQFRPSCRCHNTIQSPEAGLYISLYLWLSAN